MKKGYFVIDPICNVSKGVIKGSVGCRVFVDCALTDHETYSTGYNFFIMPVFQSLRQGLALQRGRIPPSEGRSRLGVAHLNQQQTGAKGSGRWVVGVGHQEPQGRSKGG